MKNVEKLTESIRNAEYYNMVELFDQLYERSKNNEIFENLMEIILSEENIFLAFRNIKNNTGSQTAGTDKLTMRDISKLTPDEVVENVRFILCGSQHGYRPKPVRRKEIPKPNGKTRPLGIPCIWDRLIQQCIKQVLEPICEAKFSNCSCGFRPCRSVETAIQKYYRHAQRSYLHYVVEVDIKGFFDNVNHNKLIRQLWTLGIRDKQLIYIIKQMLKAPIKLEDNTMITPDKGTPQGGTLSPLLANIVLNEFDHWIESQWSENPIIGNYKEQINANGNVNKHNAYTKMRKTRLKEIQIVRYADDFRILCRDYDTAKRIMIATKQWLQQRLKLEVSEEKTRIIDMKEKYAEFLGFKIKLKQKNNKYVIESKICDKAKERIIKELIEQAKHFIYPKDNKDEIKQIWLYNTKVMGIQNYYQIATDINLDCQEIQYRIMKILTNRMKRSNGNRLVKNGRELTQYEKQRFGKSKMLRYAAGSKEPIYPIAYIQTKHPMCISNKTTPYTPEGRNEIHSNCERK